MPTTTVRRRVEKVDVSVTVGSDNVFADLGLPSPDELLQKADLAIEVVQAIRGRKWTQAAAAAVLGIDQPKVSKLMRGHLTDFSVERLLRFLLSLNQDVHISIKPATRPGPGRVVIAAQPKARDRSASIKSATGAGTRRRSKLR